MQLSLAFHANDRAIAVPELAREAEARGFHALYLPEHTHIPTSRATPAPIVVAAGEAAELPEEYYRSPDPVVALAAAASVTRTLKLGTGVSLPVQHDVIAYAKQLATLDQLSGGRLVFGVGYGWNREEMRNHGVAPETRRARVREHVLAMQALWREERAAFDGEFVRFEESFQWPKPLQQPRPLTLIGGAASPALFAQVAEFADGWLPIGGAGVAEASAALRETCERVGRDFSELRIVPFGVTPNAGKLDHYRAQGFAECALRLPALPRDEALPALDALTRWLG